MPRKIVAVRERRECVHVLDNIVFVGLLDVYCDGNLDHDYFGRFSRRGLVIGQATWSHVHRVGLIWIRCTAGHLHSVDAILNTVQRFHANGNLECIHR